jgi:hypothetical protein
MLTVTGGCRMTARTKPARQPPPKPRKDEDATSRAFLTGGGRRVEEHLVDGPDDSHDDGGAE